MTEPETTIPTAPPRTLRTHYLALLTPLVLTHALQSTGGLLDGFWLGRLLGTRGIATAATFFPVFFLLLSLIIGLGAGATVLAGQAWGARDVAQVRRVGATATVAALAIGVVVAVAGVWSAPWLKLALGTPPDILPAAIIYARGMLLAMPFVFVAWTRFSLSRGTGDALSPMWSLLAAADRSVVHATAGSRHASARGGRGGLDGCGSAGSAGRSDLALASGRSTYL
jgi:Na+-driven multidrug efflux pump